MNPGVKDAWVGIILLWLSSGHGSVYSVTVGHLLSFLLLHPLFHASKGG